VFTFTFQKDLNSLNTQSLIIELVQLKDYSSNFQIEVNPLTANCAVAFTREYACTFSTKGLPVDKYQIQLTDYYNDKTYISELTIV